MIPLSWVCVRPKKWVIWAQRRKKLIFGPKIQCFLAPKPYYWDVIQIFCFHHDGTPYRQGFCFEFVARWAPGWLLGSKNTVFSPKKGHFGQSGPENGPPSGQTGTYSKTEGIQSYLRTWGRYDPIESGLSEAKKMSYVGVAQKKTDFWAKNAAFWPENPFFDMGP